MKHGAPSLASNGDSAFCGWWEFMNNSHLSISQDTESKKGGDAEMSVFGSLLAEAHGLEGQLE